MHARLAFLTICGVATLLGCTNPRYATAPSGPSPDRYAVAAHRDAVQARQLQRSANQQDLAADRAAARGDYYGAARHERLSDIQTRRAAQERRNSRENAALSGHW